MQARVVDAGIEDASVAPPTGGVLFAWRVFSAERAWLYARPGWTDGRHRRRR